MEYIRASGQSFSTEKKMQSSKWYFVLHQKSENGKKGGRHEKNELHLIESCFVNEAYNTCSSMHTFLIFISTLKLATRRINIEYSSCIIKVKSLHQCFLAWRKKVCALCLTARIFLFQIRFTKISIRSY